MLGRLVDNSLASVAWRRIPLLALDPDRLGRGWRWLIERRFEMPGAGKYEQRLQKARFVLITAALAAAIIIYGLKYLFVS